MSTFCSNCSLVYFSHLFSIQVDSHHFSVLWVYQCKVWQKQNCGINPVHWLACMYSPACMLHTWHSSSCISFAEDELPNDPFDIPRSLPQRSLTQPKDLQSGLGGRVLRNQLSLRHWKSFSCGRGCNCIVQSSSILIRTMRAIND